MSYESNRGTGRTSKQMVDAPKRSIFIWVNEHLSYPNNLARKIGREDLRLVGPEWILSSRWEGRALEGLVVDHACKLTTEQWYGLQRALTRVRK